MKRAPPDVRMCMPICPVPAPYVAETVSISPGVKVAPLRRTSFVAGRVTTTVRALDAATGIAPMIALPPISIGLLMGREEFSPTRATQFWLLG